MDSKEIKTLRGERKHLRRFFTLQANLFEQALENKDTTQIEESFALFADKAERLFKLDQQVSDILFKFEISDEDLDKEYESREQYRDKWISLTSRKNNLAKPDLENRILSASNCANDNARYTYKLPKLKFKPFDGSIRNWICFWSQFKIIHDDTTIDLDTKFHYLIQTTVEGSPARDLIDSFPPSGKNYGKAIELMRNRFGREDLLIELYVRELLTLVLTQASNNKFTSLRALYDKLETQLRALETLGVTSDKYAYMLSPLVKSALPETTLKEWERNRTRLRANSSEEVLKELLDFLKSEVESEESITLAKTSFATPTLDNEPSSYNKRVQNKIPKSRPMTAAGLVAVKSSNSNCVFCDGQHNSADCFKARAFSLAEIERTLKEKGCCLSCLKRGHLKRQCRTFLKCIICNGKHLPLLCPERSSGAQTKKDTFIKVEQALTDTQNNLVYLKTMKVVLRNGSNEYPARLFFDEGSQRSYITKRMAKRLGYKPIGSETLIHGLFGGTHSEPEEHTAYHIRVGSVVNDYACNFRVLDKETICDSLPVAKHGPWIKEIEQMNIVLSDEEGGQVDVLVGADIAGKLLTGGRKVLDCGLIALETLLGWTLMGKPNRVKDNAMSNTTYSFADISATGLGRLDLIGIENPIEETERRRKPKKTTKKTTKKKPTRKSIFEIYEPSELKRGHFTGYDNKIRNADMPERMQLREVAESAVPEGSDELDEEAEWIYKQAFCRPKTSTQEWGSTVDQRGRPKKDPLTVGKIKKALDFMRNYHFEVPFIAFYRKEYVLPELNINDLWRVFKYDAKWCRLKLRKLALLKLMEQMRDYQCEELLKDVNATIPDSVKVIIEEDIQRLKAVQTTEGLKDVHSHFLMYYSEDGKKMLGAVRARERLAAREKARQERKNNEEDDEEKIREELKDLIDDNPIEESESGSEDSQGSDEDRGDRDRSGGEKRKKHDEDFDDRLEDEDYDLLEENLGHKIERRKRFKRLRRIEDEEFEACGLALGCNFTSYAWGRWYSQNGYRQDIGWTTLSPNPTPFPTRSHELRSTRDAVEIYGRYSRGRGRGRR